MKNDELNEMEQETTSVKEVEQENLRAKDVAIYLSIGLSTVWMYANQGKLKPIKVSKRVTVFKKSDVDRFVNESVVAFA